MDGDLIALNCRKCSEERRLTEDDARFTFAALRQWCCPGCGALQPWPVHLLGDQSRAEIDGRGN